MNRKHLILDLNVILMKIFHVQSKDNPSWTKVGWNDIVKYQFTSSVIDYICERFLQEGYYDTLWICADGHNSWRKDVVSTYKANRIADPDNPIDMPFVFKNVFEYCKEEVEKYFNIDIFRANRVEGDDMVFFLVNELAKDEDADVTVFTIDHDLWQILRPNVYIIDQKFHPVTVKGVMDDIAVELEHIFDTSGNSNIESSFKHKDGITDVGTVTYIDDASMIWKNKILDGDVSDNIIGAFVRKKEVKDNKNGGTKLQNRKLTAKEKETLYEKLGNKEFTFDNVWEIVKTFKDWKDYCTDSMGDDITCAKRMDFINNDILIRMGLDNYPSYIKESFNNIYNNKEKKLSMEIKPFMQNMIPYVSENKFTHSASINDSLEVNL